MIARMAPRLDVFQTWCVRAFAAAALLLQHTQAAPDPLIAPARSEGAQVRVISFNIRNSGARDGANGWPQRRERVVATIREFAPDLVGTQEVLADQYDELRDAFPEYAVEGVARDDGARRGEWALVLFRKGRFDRIDAGNFWLSETPEAIGSKSWDAANVRICSWVKLRDKVTQTQIVFANTHFDHKGAVARRESAALLRARLAALAKNDPLILAGDFNCTEIDEPYRLLVRRDEAPDSALQLIDGYRQAHPEPHPDEATFHGFKGILAGRRIDWILHSPHFQTVAAAIVRTPAQPLSSDHYPVTAVLTYRQP